MKKTELERLDREMKAGLGRGRQGDICPSQNAIVIMGRMKELAVQALRHPGQAFLRVGQG